MNKNKGGIKMTATQAVQLTTKENLCRRILDLPAETVEWLSQCLDDFETYEPNEETIRAIKESMNPENLLGPYSTVEEMFEDFGIDVDAQSVKNLQA
jgi:hypothetical protein